MVIDPKIEPSALEPLAQSRPSPDNILVRVRLAAMYKYEGRHEEARVLVREALQVNPDLTAEIATRMIPGLEQVYGAEKARSWKRTCARQACPGADG